MKRLFQMLLVIALVAVMASPTIAASSRRGKKVFKKHCKTCHTSDGEGGKLSPIMKTQAQWRLYFKDDKHAKKPAVWEGMSKKDKENLLKFFLDFALDSDQPETCG